MRTRSVVVSLISHLGRISRHCPEGSPGLGVVGFDATNFADLPQKVNTGICGLDGPEKYGWGRAKKEPGGEPGLMGRRRRSEPHVIIQVLREALDHIEGRPLQATAQLRGDVPDLGEGISAVVLAGEYLHQV